MKAIATALALLTLSVCANAALAAEGGKGMDKIIITRNGSVAAVKGPESTFTGNVAAEFLAPRRGESRLSAGLVSFQPGARSNWHTHPYGQLLIIVEGKGRVCEWGGPVEEVQAGDLVWFPAGVKHWHGAAPDAAMRHYAVQEELEGKAADWLEKVSDAEYGGR